jgi:hypothetical protein
MLLPLRIACIPRGHRQTARAVVALVTNRCGCGHRHRAQRCPYLVGREFEGTIRAYDEQSGAFVIVLADLLEMYRGAVDVVVVTRSSDGMEWGA